jgi:aminoglycoside phosphotransferase (APT) family kinase protein
MEKHQLGSVRSLKIDQNGWVNPCIFVNDDFVFRFNARDPQLPKFQREKIAYDLLRNSDIPVPQKVFLDDSKTDCEFDVLISEKISGLNLEAQWPQLDSQDRAELAEQAGRLQKLFEGKSFPFFGELTTTGPFKQHSTWTECLRERLNYHLSDTLSLNVFTDTEALRFEKIFNEHSTILDQVKTSHLVHGDFHFGNLLFDGTQIKAVLDFEWSFAGDPLFDLSNWSDSYDVWQESKDPFLKGLGLELTDEDHTKIKIYKMIRNIELCAVAKRYFSSEEALEYKKTTLARIDRL